MEYSDVPLEEEHRRVAILRIDSAPVLCYMDEHENPLRRTLHFHVEQAMEQAQIEYGVNPEEWQPVTDRAPWKKRSSRRSRRSRHRYGSW